MFLARGNLVMALGVVASTILFQVFSGLPPTPLAPLVSFLTIFAVYGLDRIIDLEADRLTHPERALFARRNARWIRTSAWGAYALALALAGARGIGHLAVSLIPLVALALYSVPFLPPALSRAAGFSRIKEVLVLKNLWVAGTLTATAALFTLVDNDDVPALPAVLVTCVFLFGRWLINVILFDFRDEAGDRASGLRTVPVVLGRARTLRLLHGLNAALAILCLGAPALGAVQPTFAILGLSSIYAWSYLRKAANDADLHFLCDVISDGEQVPLAAIVLIGVAFSSI